MASRRDAARVATGDHHGGGVVRRRGRDRYRPAQARAGRGDVLPPYVHQLANLHASLLSDLWGQIAATSGFHGVSVTAPSKGEIRRQMRSHFASALRGGT